ncbi:hypothetical protein [Nocardia sp. NPDC003979]
MTEFVGDPPVADYPARKLDPQLRFIPIRALSTLGLFALLLSGCSPAERFPSPSNGVVNVSVPDLHEASCTGYRWMADRDFGQYSIASRVGGRDWKQEWNRLPALTRDGNSFLTEVTGEVPICVDRTADDIVAAAQELCAEAVPGRILTDPVYRIQMKQTAIDRAGLGLPIWVEGGPHGSQHRGLDKAVEHFLSRVTGTGTSALFPDGCPDLT